MDPINACGECLSHAANGGSGVGATLSGFADLAEEGYMVSPGVDTDNSHFSWTGCDVCGAVGILYEATLVPAA